MNAEPQYSSSHLPPSALTSVQIPDTPHLDLVRPPVVETSTVGPQPSAKAPRSTYRPKGKIASLPREQRDIINLMLLNGAIYAAIRDKMAEYGVSLNLENISNWHHGGHQLWLQERACLALLGAKSEFSADVLATPDNSKLHEAGFRLAAAHMLDQLMRFAAAESIDDPDAHAEKFARLVNALSRLNREALAFQKYRDTIAQAQAAELKKCDINRELSDNEFDLLTQKMDQVFKVARRKPAAPPANGNGAVTPADPSSASSAGVPPASSAGQQARSPSSSSSSSSSIPSASAHASSAGVSPASSVCVSPANCAAAALAGTSSADLQSTETAPDRAQSGVIENQNSRIKNPNPPGNCPACTILLPPLLKNGERSIPVCPKCGSALCSPPSWTSFDYPPPKINPSACDICRQRHQLDPNGLPDPCTQCGFHAFTHPAPPAPPKPDST